MPVKSPKRKSASRKRASPKRKSVSRKRTSPKRKSASKKTFKMPNIEILTMPSLNLPNVLDDITYYIKIANKQSCQPLNINFPSTNLINDGSFVERKYILSNNCYLHVYITNPDFYRYDNRCIDELLSAKLHQYIKITNVLWQDLCDGVINYYRKCGLEARINRVCSIVPVVNQYTIFNVKERVKEIDEKKGVVRSSRSVQTTNPEPMRTGRTAPPSYAEATRQEREPTVSRTNPVPLSQQSTLPEQYMGQFRGQAQDAANTLTDKMQQTFMPLNPSVGPNDLTPPPYQPPPAYQSGN